MLLERTGKGEPGGGRRDGDLRVRACCLATTCSAISRHPRRCWSVIARSLVGATRAA